MKRLLCGLAIILGIMVPVMLATTQSVWAADPSCNVLDCSSASDPEGGGIWYILNLVLIIMTFGVTTLGILGLIISGVQYITAGDNPERMQKAKSRIINVLIGLAAYAVLWAALNWLLPGGIFHS